MTNLIDKESQDRTKIVLRKLGITSPVLLGKGGEGPVYERGDDALKIFLHTTDVQYLKNIKEFQNRLSRHQFTFSIPQIYEVGEVDGTLYTIEKKLHGIPMDKRIVTLASTDRQKLYGNYYGAIRQVGAVSFPELPYGHIIKTDQSITSESWPYYLTQVLEQKTAKTRARMLELVPDFDRKVKTMSALIQTQLRDTQKQLVHCDYYLNNVLTDDDLNISAVLDFSQHCAVGDPRQDMASVLTWNEIDPNVKPEDYMFLYDQAKSDFGEDIVTRSELYLLFSSFYFADMEDPSFSIKHLNNERLWSKYT